MEEEATVDEAVEAFYYPQVGRRSWGGAARYGIEGRDVRLEYADWWNRTGILWPSDGVGSRRNQCAQTGQTGR